MALDLEVNEVEVKVLTSLASVAGITACSGRSLSINPRKIAGRSTILWLSLMPCLISETGAVKSRRTLTMESSSGFSLMVSQSGRLSSNGNSIGKWSPKCPVMYMAC
jgi:hypothetical protein